MKDYAKTLARLVAYACYLTGTCIIITVLVELVFQIRYELAPFTQISCDVPADAGYATETEYCEIREEQDKVTWGMGRYEPYVEWSRCPYNGRFVSIGRNGLRKTLVNNCSMPIRIHVYGGSTVWGTGVKDADTLPSLLSTLVSEQLSGCYEVTNCGEGGYVTAQDLNKFVAMIRGGNAPDVAVFLGGINDAYVAYQDLQAGYPQFSPLLAERLDPRNNTRNALVLRVIRTSYTYKTFVDNIAKPYEPNDAVEARIAATEAAALAFIENYSMAKAIADSRGIECFFVLQPSLHISKKRLTEREKAVLASQDRRLVEVMTDFFNLVRRKSSKLDLVDLSTMLDNEQNNVFADRFHLTPSGNMSLARKIAELIISKEMATRKRHQDE